MPEYLAPGVYVEEVSSGNKPIEGVSTSTAGVVGVTRRGPVDQPTLVTSLGEFHRIFGGRLDHRVFTNGLDALPYAVEGFFQNNGSRIYVSRIVGTDADRAETDLYAIPPTDRAQSRLNSQAPQGSTSLVVDANANISDGDTLLIHDDTRSEYVTRSGSTTPIGVRLSYALRDDVGTGPVNLQTVTITSDLSDGITTSMDAGGQLQLDETTVAGLSSGNILRIRDTANPEHTEYVTITTNGEADFDEGSLVFNHPLEQTEIHHITLAAEGTSLNLDEAATTGDTNLIMADTTGLSPDSTVEIGGGIYHLAALTEEIPLGAETEFVHRAGVPLIKQVAVLRAHAHHPGIWGNALRARIRPSSILNTTVSAGADTGDTPVPLDAVYGVNTGTVLEFSRDGQVVQVLRVSGVNRATNEVAFAGGLEAPVQAGDTVRSLEFTLVVELLENDRVAESEVFDYLALDPEHPRYAVRVVGSFNRSTGRTSRSGAAELIRLSDLSFEDDGVTSTSDAADLRLADPFAGVTHDLAGGIDDLGSIDDGTYIGSPSDDPDERTGIHSLANRDDISLVAVPGQSGVDVQKALLGHCERMRYRFAILDAESGAALDRVQTHRQNYDSTRGAYYYPWLVISDPFGEDGDLLTVPPVAMFSALLPAPTSSVAYTKRRPMKWCVASGSSRKP
ncbi:hypothetical protein ACFOZ5_18365 [Marinobacter lacisalsi]|uniref:Uncharacterized protein n=1 Tax=Marinobacter lacisalsi TaxID=475979 RepID=A0ABV8QPK3_9GAMM